MSGLKPPEMSKFARSLSDRGTSVQKLADEINCSRPTLTRILNGSRRRNWLWDKVRPLLTDREIELLDVALRHPWNKQRIAKRPKWKNVSRQFLPAA